MRFVPAILMLVSCTKVPIIGVEASFSIADVSWFAEEETLFVFYQVSAEQGIEDPSVIELTYTTDEERTDWIDLSAIDPIHTHLEVDCGQNTLCGSVSVRIPIEPRDVRIRLRYHRDGELALNAETIYNVVGPGPAHSNRSLTVYGVFDAGNESVQWRSRNEFPTIRNEEATRLGLRRQFTIDSTRYGDIDAAPVRNPYRYGTPCPADFVDTEMDAVQTTDRAIFHPDRVPIEASAFSALCARSTVTDATGEFRTPAVARKNPEVRAAFPELASPVRDATVLPFFFKPCDREIDAQHETMQRQRLFLQNLVPVCTEGFEEPGFVDELVVRFGDAIEEARVDGDDMVMVIGVHQDQSGVSQAVQDALAVVLPPERNRNTPRVAGAFVLDSTTRGLTRDELLPSTLWCPANLTAGGASSTCAIAPDNPDLTFGPFTFGQLPILPDREQFRDFVDTFSVAQSGEVTALSFPTPEFAADAEHLDFGEFGSVTFLNGETLGSDPDDAFSVCAQGEAQRVIVRSPLMENPSVLEFLREACANGEVPPDLCVIPDAGVMPIQSIPTWHNLVGESSYEIGLFWEFPFLTRMEYNAAVGGSVSAFGFSVPFGARVPDEAFFGTDAWLVDSFSLDPELTQCRRFCDNPTFDGAGVYQVLAPFRNTYANVCYVPDFPTRGDGGFPRDP